jgi:type IV fimbrial biogenesis protein FimT
MIAKSVGLARHGGQRVIPRGFTLIELMVGLLVLAILLGIAVPSFRDASLGSRLTGYSNDMVASVMLARSEAIKRNVNVVLCSAAPPADADDPVTCSGDANWEIGWVVGTLRDVPRLDEDGDPVLDDDGVPVVDAVVDVLSQQPPLAPEFRFTAAGGVSAIEFPPTVVGVTGASFTVCRASPVGKQERRVTVSATGSAVVTQPDAVGDCPGA